MWVFGYGSLMWKVDFPYEKKLPGYIKGYVRRFYQKSTDHRGIPSKPGRVVTLLESANDEDQVWGLAYQISPENVDNVVNHLDFRERGGYTRKTVLFYPCEATRPTNQNASESRTSRCGTMLDNNDVSSGEVPFHLTIYIGGEDNLNFAGAESTETIAGHILEARGPSGANTEYLYNLAAAMRAVAPQVRDEHLFHLEEVVKGLEEEKEKSASAMNDTIFT